ncbi:MAG TPA: PASTA domain-containing protein [Pyrinomonadaceae bacterium]|nr:PASTA domain-containing protein [Pyrinomonadaceae bacterium]
MESGNFDFIAIISAVGVSLVVGGILYFVTNKRAEWKKARAVLITGSVGIGLLAGIIAYLMWPSLISVPNLDGLSQAEAEDTLRSYHLVPQPRPQYAQTADAGRVIARSQNPAAGLAVRAGAVVSFAVGERGEPAPDNNPNSSNMDVSFSKPRAGEKISCRIGADGIGRITVEGTSSGVSNATHGLLLWIRPINPPADQIGWYLQRPPSNGIPEIGPDGSWTGVAQIGNAQYPPHEGDTIGVTVTIAEKGVIDKMRAELGVTVRNQPVGVKSATLSPVTLTLK